MTDTISEPDITTESVRIQVHTSTVNERRTYVPTRLDMVLDDGTIIEYIEHQPEPAPT